MPAVLFFGLWLLALNATAAPLPSEARLQALAEDRQWLTLTHYRPKSVGRGWHGSANDSAFYLAEQDNPTPLQELRATLAALQSPGPVDDQHPRCRFPARTAWLQTQLPDLAVAQGDCPEYQAWRERTPDERLVLIFPAAYLNSPSSMFGHTFLRLDPADADVSSTLLSHALDFAAIVDSQDNDILFAWRGMTGGYPGHFSIMPYHRKVREYSALENRDIWEYPMVYTPEEIDFLLKHVWEVRQIRFDYYFTSENCSYQLLALLDVLRPDEPLAWQFGLTTIPVDTVRAAQRAGLIEDAHYRPSRTSEFRQTLEQLPEAHRSLVARLVRDQDFETAMAETARLPESERAMTYLGAHRLARLVAQQQGNPDELRRRSHQLLLARSQLQASTRFDPEPPTRAEHGHRSRRLQLAAGHFDDEGYLGLSWRPSFHHLSDPMPGYGRGAQINFLDTELRYWEDEGLRLERLDIIDVRSLSPRDRYLKSWSWQVRTGLERVYDGPDERRLQPHLQAGFGHSYALGDRLMAFVLPVASLEHQRGNERPWQLAPGVQSGLAWHSPQLTLVLEAEHLWFPDVGQERQQASLTSAWSPQPDHSLSVELRGQRGFGRHWVSGGQLAWRYFY
ncbi:Lnb N-terminal periplasmic domain-containing protein [Marinimicrobium alkaliphilum]|uniref:Lnb N-terminal periplasmic domain-containing protein n=1 Tax=Marinimicrobium alkaliphilum TaxID=2202654 RepID=UPI001300526E|nr:DUF4105 domain-containing protein [Marinimicrobium alkaliphilum]